MGIIKGLILRAPPSAAKRARRLSGGRLGLPQAGKRALFRRAHTCRQKQKNSKKWSGHCARLRFFEKILQKSLPNLDKRSTILYNDKAIGVWHSLVVCLVRDQEAAGSSPATPTIKNPFCLCRTDFFMRRKAAAYGFICGLRLCERVISKTKRRGFASSPEKNKKHPRGVLFYGITPRKT